MTQRIKRSKNPSLERFPLVDLDDLLKQNSIDIYRNPTT